MPSSRELYELLIRYTADGVLVSDAHNLIQKVNPAAAAMLSLTVEEILGRSPTQCFRHNPALINLFTRTDEQILDIRLPKRRLAVGIGTDLSSGGRLVLLQDVTEKRDIDSRRESLVKSVAHDLRNPISAITGYVDLIAKFGELNEQQTRFHQRVQQTTSKLHDVSESLVDLAWIEAGMPIEHMPLQLSRIIDKVVSDLSGLALNRHITIAVSVQSPMPLVMGDARRMTTVIYNLLHNAIIYSYPQQTVAIHAWGDTHEAYCSVADQGIGISDDELELIFDRLYRSRDERVREIPGGGLGLTMARKIIARHGGDIWASSNLGEGSTFTFVLPVVQER